MIEGMFMREMVVNWPDADGAGIVWFGHFCRYVEETEEEMFRALGRARREVAEEMHIFMPRTHLQLGFRSPAKLNDRLRIGLAAIWRSDRRIEYVFAIEQLTTGEPVCDGKYRIACVSPATFKAQAFPKELASLLAPYTFTDAGGRRRIVSTDSGAASGC